MKHALICSLLLAAGSPGVTPQAAEPEETSPPARERLERPEEKARTPRPEGPPGEAGRLAAAREKRPPADQEHFRQLRVKRAEMLAKLERLRAEGRDQDAAALKERIRALDEEMAALRARPGPPAPPRPARPLPPEPGPEPRHRHLQAAIDNLHAAGLHELAERLEREREALLRPERAPGPEAVRELQEEIRRLRAELNEVRQALRRLHERVERAPAPGH
jgi:DNA repair exonuclease SbcCD ATPase subunit